MTIVYKPGQKIQQKFSDFPLMGEIISYNPDDPNLKNHVYVKWFFNGKEYLTWAPIANIKIIE